MNDVQRTIMKKINWDYSIPEVDLFNCLRGITNKAGVYTREELIIKMLNNLYWYDINKIFSLDEIKPMLTKKIIEKLRAKSNKLKYEYLRRLLHKETISVTGWSNPDCKFPSYPVLSHRRYCT